MSYEFCANPDPSRELCSEVAALAPTNPFYTHSYIQARRSLGFQPLVLTLRRYGKLVSAFPAFMKSGYLNRSLEITSFTSLPDSDVFWKELLQSCDTMSVSYLQVNSFASTKTTIPFLIGETKRRVRWEYLLELKNLDLWNQLSSNHLRNIKRGRQLGFQVRNTVNPQACQEHANLVRASLNRRKRQGESVPEHTQGERFTAFLRSGAGELFQVILDGQVLASVLVLIAERGAYYQSAGTSPEGMQQGASHFLVYEIANSFRQRSLEVFNLGGADQLNPGLQRFKAGFGATTVKLEAAQFFIGNRFKKQLGTIVGLLRQ